MNATITALTARLNEATALYAETGSQLNNGRVHGFDAAISLLSSGLTDEVLASAAEAVAYFKTTGGDDFAYGKALALTTAVDLIEAR